MGRVPGAFAEKKKRSGFESTVCGQGQDAM